MVKIGWIDLLQSISHLGSLSVGKQPSMREYVRGITTVNFGGTFAMKKNDNNDKDPTEGQALILTMVMLIGVTLLLNGCANLFMRIM
tara:strand:- start:3901 stop:4161 length:261 start_codon:yes stop_codon:yes gene_type:complete